MQTDPETPKKSPGRTNETTPSSIRTSSSAASLLDNAEATISLRVGDVLYEVKHADLKAVSPKYFGIHLERGYSKLELARLKGETPVWPFEGDGELFRYIKDYAETGRRPLLYDCHEQTFDTVKYQRLLIECQRFEVDRLCKWIEEEEFLDVVKRRVGYGWQWGGEVDERGNKQFEQVVVADETVVDETRLMERRATR